MKVLETVHLLWLLAVNICTDVVRAVSHDLALFCADFHSICRCSVYEPVGESLKFTVAAAHKIDVVGKSQVPSMEMDMWWSWSCVIFSRNKLNRMGESKHPWRTPTVILKNSPSWLFKRTAPLEFSYSAWMAWTRPSSVTRHAAYKTRWRNWDKKQLSEFGDSCHAGKIKELTIRELTNWDPLPPPSHGISVLLTACQWLLRSCNLFGYSLVLCEGLRVAVPIQHTHTYPDVFNPSAN